MHRSTLSLCAVLALSLAPAAASADAMCGGPKRRPEPMPPPSSSGFATPPPPQGSLGVDDGARLGARPVEPVELGMAGGMVLLGGAAGLASRGKKKGERK